MRLDPAQMLAYSAAGFVAWYFLIAVVMRFVNTTNPSWAVSEIMIGFASLIGAVVAASLHMSILAGVLSALVGYSASHLIFHMAI